MRVTVLAGGIGGARFLRGVAHALPDAQIRAIVNTGDDITLHGLRICPDLDSIMYTLGGGTDDERGWGRAEESWRVKDELAAYGAEPTWFGLGDLDLATHLVRTQMLDAGYRLTDVTAALCQRWNPGVELLPMTDDRCETHVLVELDGARRAIHFQQWWIKHRASLPALAFVQVGLDDASASPDALAAITDADVVLLAPSNPVVSIGTILGLGELRAAVHTASAPVVGYSPIIGNAPVRGMADSCLPALGVEVSAQGVGRHYGGRTHSPDGVLDAWLIQEGESAEIAGVSVHAVPLLMSDVAASAQMVRAGLAAVGVSV